MPAPTIQAGETAANFAARVLDYGYKTGSGVGSEHARMAQTWLSPIVIGPTINGFVVA